MRIIKKILVLGIALFAFEQVQAQQDPLYTQYMYNTTLINPAYAGSRGTLSIFGQYRTQWVGLEGAPKTANFSVHSPIGDSPVGLGINFTNDKIGAMDENTISIDFSYTIDVSWQYKLAFGLKGIGNILSVDYTKLNIYQPEPVFDKNISNKFNPNFGVGAYLYSEKSYLGLSIPTILTRTRYKDNEMEMMREKMHFYLMGGYVFDLDPNFKLKPAFLLGAVSGAPMQVDVSANLLMYDKFTAGVSYRWDAAVSGLVGFQVNEGLFIGYSYDTDTSNLRRYNSGSHEILLRFELKNTFKKVNSPRFF